MVAAAELYSWDSAVLLTAGVPVAVVPGYESGRGPGRNGEATDAELPQKHKMRIRTRDTTGSTNYQRAITAPGTDFQVNYLPI